MDISDGAIVVKESNMYANIHIFEVTPLTLLEYSSQTQNNILSTYISILRQIDFDFQILISNRKLDVDEYISKKMYSKQLIKSKDNTNINKVEEFYGKYIKDVRDRIEKEDIYVTKYYIVLKIVNKEDDANSCNEKKTKEVAEIFGKLELLGCIVSKLEKKEDLEKLLFEFVNK